MFATSWPRTATCSMCPWGLVQLVMGGLQAQWGDRRTVDLSRARACCSPPQQQSLARCACPGARGWASLPMRRVLGACGSACLVLEVGRRWPALWGKPTPTAVAHCGSLLW